MRLPDFNGLPIDAEKLLSPKDYIYLPEYDLWLACAPNGDMGTLRPNVHRIEVHQDGTISVSPSIQFETGKRWHGFLKKGEWSK